MDYPNIAGAASFTNCPVGTDEAAQGIGIDEAIDLSLIMDAAYHSHHEGRKMNMEELSVTT